MGLFSSKQDRADEAVENAKLFYERFERSFIHNLSIKDTTIEDRMNNRLFGFYHNRRLFELHSISALFDYYPSILLNDNEYNNLHPLLMPYGMPCPVKYCHLRDRFLSGIEKGELTVEEEKESYDQIRYRKRLVLEKGAFDIIDNCIRELNTILSNAATAIKEAESGFFTRQNRSDLWKEVMVIEYRCKAAIGWFNFLYKQEKR